MANPSNDYPVTAPGRAPLLTLAAIAGLLLLGLWLALRHHDSAPHSPLTGYVLATIGLSVAAATLYFGLTRRSVRIEASQLQVIAGLHRHRVAAGELDLQHARVVDLAEHTDLAPRLHTMGLSLPGYQAGWFRTRQWRKVFCLVTARRRVLWLPERGGGALLLSLERPEALLERLRAMASRAG